MESQSTNKKEQPSRGRNHKSRSSQSKSKSKRSQGLLIQATSASDANRVSLRSERQAFLPPSRSASRPPSAHSHRRSSSQGQSRSRRGSTAEFAENHRHELMVSYINKQQITRRWVSGNSGTQEGCILRRDAERYVTSPATLKESNFAKAMQQLQVQSAMTVNSRPIKAWLQANPEAISLPLGGGTSVQMLPSYSMIGMCRLAQQAAFVADHGLLVVWDEDPTNLFHRAVGIEKELIDTLWTIEKTGNEPEPLEKRGEAPPKIGDRVVKREKPVETDLEAGQFTIRKRPVNILNAFYVALTIAAITASLAAGMRQVLRHVLINGDYRQVGLCTLVPIQIFFTLFFAQVIFGSLGQILGPIRHLEYNSRHYSGELPPRLPTGTHLPNVTIQCPVYKEGLHSVIKPTVRSIQAAMTTYERQGGHVNLFVNDDGLQLLGEAEKTARLKFYKDNNIGWVARPPHGHNDFQRRGKFKKASNMNYAIMISSKLEEIFENKASQEVDSKNCLLCAKNSDKQALEQAIAETGGVAWAGGDIHIGDYILLVDSDTRVPPDHLLDAVSEMEQSPDVGILQFTSAVMQVAHNYFENGIAFFTNMIYSAIKYTVANGDVSPFVGHNAILRWTAIQELSYRDSDGYDKIWSESHVSEDFDMSLRLQGKGYNIRLATWGGDGFKEGVSLTVYDELARWEKYAYGCNELLFNPIRLWPVCGPFTPLFRQFLRSAIPLPSKLTVLSYIGTYYAIASAWLLTSANFFIWGWYADQMDHYYINSWQVWFSILVVFTGLGNVALAFMRYRCKERDLFESLLENFKWVVMMAIFLGGLSMHLSAALLSHMFEIKMAWGATAKEVEDSNFFKELPKIFKKFKFSMIYSILFSIGMAMCALGPVPWNWTITDFVAILPMSAIVISHFLLPLVLNPALMKAEF